MKNALGKSWIFPLKASLFLLLVFGLLLSGISSAANYIFKPEHPEVFFMVSFSEVLMMAGMMIYFKARNLIRRRVSRINNKTIRIMIPDTVMISLLIVTGMSLHVGYHVINHMMDYWDVCDFLTITTIFVLFFAAFVFLFYIVSAADHFIKKLNPFLKTITSTIIGCFICFLLIESYKLICRPFFIEDILYFIVFSFCFCISISRFVILKTYFDKAIGAREKVEIDKFKPIIFTKHAYRYQERRGFTTEEVEDAIRSEEWRAADFGRLECQKEFSYSTEWNGNFYATKQVRPIFVDETEEIVVITVYTYYY